MSVTMLTPDHNHDAIPHADGKPPWCHECGLTAANTAPETWLL